MVKDCLQDFRMENYREEKISKSVICYRVSFGGGASSHLRSISSFISSTVHQTRGTRVEFVRD